MKLQHNLSLENEWTLVQHGIPSDLIIETGSNFLIGNGFMGIRGVPCDGTASEYVAITVTGTWDMVPETNHSELCTVPNPLFASLSIDGAPLCSFSESSTILKLNIKSGIFSRTTTWEEKGIELFEERFIESSHLGRIYQRIRIRSTRDNNISVDHGIDSHLWSLHGDHFKAITIQKDNSSVAAFCETQEHNQKISVTHNYQWDTSNEVEVVTANSADSSNGKVKSIFALGKGQTASLTTVSEIAISLENFEKQLPENSTVPLFELFDSQKLVVASTVPENWKKKDVLIEGNAEDQFLVRFNTYHAVIATPTHATLPIGARGLSCQVYQGAAFLGPRTL